MTDKVKFYIPVGNVLQMAIRDELVKRLAPDYDAVVIHCGQYAKQSKKDTKLCSLSIVEVYVDEVTEIRLEYFKALTDFLSQQIGDSVMVEIIKNIAYIGTANHA